MSLRPRFLGLDDGWARFDGPSGTQMVDVAATAMTDWIRSGNTAAAGGPFAAAEACAALMDRTRAAVGALLGADPGGVCFGLNSTSNVLALSRAVGATLQPGDRLVGTRLDHDANVTPWRIAADRAGATQVLAAFDPVSGLLDPQSVIDLIDERTRWVTVPGASNLLGSVTDLAPIVGAAHAVGANVFVDAVALAPHRSIDVAALGVDALATSPYKWYGPHTGVLWVRPELLDALPIAKVRPAADTGPRRFETGMPNFEGIAGIEAAARFLQEETMARIEAVETDLCSLLLDGLGSIPGVRIWGPPTIEHRVPTVAFTVDGHAPAEVAVALAVDKIAVWDGHNYAVEVVGQLGLAESGGVVRAGIVRYIEPDEITRLVTSVARLAASR
jgi:cysteine desulfurase family protein (TIGR01976 family)